MFKANSFNKIFFRIIILVAMIPLLILSITILGFSINRNLDNIEKEAKNYIINVHNVIDDIYNDCFFIINDFDNKVQNLDITKEETIYPFLYAYAIKYHSTSKVYITLPEENIIMLNEQFNQTYIDPREKKYYINASLMKNDEIIFVKPYHWPSIDENTMQHESMFSKKITRNNVNIGTLTVDLNLEHINHHIEDLPINHNEKIVVFDEKNLIVSSNDKKFIQHIESNTLIIDHINRGDNKIKVDDESYIVNSLTHESTGLNIVIFEIESQIWNPFIQNFTFIMVVILLCITIVFPSSSIAKKYLIRPIDKLKNDINQIGINDAEEEHIHLTSDVLDEFEPVINSLNIMLDRILQQSLTVKEKNKAINEQLDIINKLYKDTEGLYKEVQEKNVLLKQNYKQTIIALSSTLEEKNALTQGHSKRVAKWAVAIAKQLNYSKEDIEKIEIAALLHDIGKVVIDNSIIDKPGKLAEKELDHIKLHPITGKKILSDITSLKDIPTIIEQHHERPDGKGYPYGLTLDEIHPLALIISVADAYDVMISLRPYKDNMLCTQGAIDELNANKGTQFGNKEVDVLVQIIRNEIK